VTGPLTPHVIAATATNRRSQFNSDWRSRMGGERTTIPEVSCNVYLDTCQMSRIIGNVRERSYSARNASTGEMRLVRSAGTREATNADSPSAATAADVTEGLNGFTP
jgi:hypothetical protein